MVNLLHSDFFSPARPRVRVFSDRIEFENPGAFPRSIDILLHKDISIPRNPVLAKLFRCAKLAENAGYGFDKMLKWEKPTHTKVRFENSVDTALVVFSFFENKQRTPQVSPQVTPQVRELIKILDREMNRQEIQEKLNLSDRENFRLNYLKPALESALVEMTLPDKPNSRYQKYRLTAKGKKAVQ